MSLLVFNKPCSKRRKQGYIGPVQADGGTRNFRKLKVFEMDISALSFIAFNKSIISLPNSLRIVCSQGV